MKKLLLLTILIFIWILSVNPIFAEEDGLNKTELSNQVLILIGQRCVPSRFSPFNWKDGKTPHTLVYVIGIIGTDGKKKELFIFPVPDTEDKWMSPEEAEGYNETNKK